MDEETRAKLAEVARKQVVYRIPGMDDVQARRDIVYKTTAAGPLLMDVYYPPGATSRAAVPVVAIVLGYPDPEGGGRTFGPLTSWARLIAMSGIAAAIYGTSSPDDDVRDAFAFLRGHADSLGIDSERVGVYAASANVSVALSLLMRDASFKCAVLLNGYTFDVDGSTAFAEASRQYGFANATAGRSIDELPVGVPLFVLRAGREHGPGINEALDQLAAR